MNLSTIKQIMQSPIILKQNSSIESLEYYNTK